MWYEIGNLLLQMITLVVLFLTLMKLNEYVADTKRIADASVEQLPRPCIIVMQDSDSTDYAIVEGVGASISKYPTLRFKNVGTGPGLNINYEIDTGSVSAFVADGAPLQPGEVFVSSWSRQSLGNPATIVVTFDSLGGTKYRATPLIEDRQWVKKAQFCKAT
jgi:hypothetical protein